jgi:hypothetical protein
MQKAFSAISSCGVEPQSLHFDGIFSKTQMELLIGKMSSL